MRRRASLAAWIVLFPGVRPLAAQRLPDWPIRASAGAEALVPGAAAALWNPAAVGLAEGRLEALAADIDGPASMGLGGKALAVAWRPGGRTTVALGYHHIEIDRIPRTSTSPIPDAPDAGIDLGEDLVAAAPEPVVAVELLWRWNYGFAAPHRGSCAKS